MPNFVPVAKPNSQSTPRSSKFAQNGANKFRRRRIFWVLALTVCGLFYYMYQSAQFSVVDRFVSIAGSRDDSAMTMSIKEIYGLLHMVTAPEKYVMTQENVPHPESKLALRSYLPVGARTNWPANLERLETKFPVIVFSKTYCPWSKRAKELLATYKLDPAPKIVEVDLRDDGAMLKLILGRLTQRSTFPNIVVRGTSIGGYDSIAELHAGGTLKTLFEEHGISVHGSVDH